MTCVCEDTHIHSLTLPKRRWPWRHWRYVSRKELFFIWQQQQQPACLPASSLPGFFLTLTRSRSRTAGATARQQLTLRQFFIELYLPVSSSGSIFTSVVAAAPFSEFALPPSALCSFHRGGIACYLLLLHTYIHYIHWIFNSHCSPVHGGLRPAGHHPSNPLHRSFLELVPSLEDGRRSHSGMVRPAY